MLKMFEEEVIVSTKQPASRGPSQGRMLLKVKEEETPSLEETP
jgi:hypothetical protein